MKSDELAKAVDRFITQIKKEHDIIGITLCGSYARGQWKPGSDIDISFLVRSGASVGQFSREFEGIVFDYGIDTPESLTDLLLNEHDLDYRKMVAHSLSTYSEIIYDPYGEAEKVKNYARNVTDKFEVRYNKEEK